MTCFRVEKSVSELYEVWDGFGFRGLGFRV